MLDALLSLLLTVHLLLVDVAMAGPLVCVWLAWRSARFGDMAADQVGRRLARTCLVSLLVGTALGAILLGARWWLDDHDYWSAAQRVPASRLWFGLLELLFSWACLAIYWGIWRRAHRRWLLHGVLAVAASSNLMLHFPALFVIISVLGGRLPGEDQPLDRAGYQQMLLDAEVLSRVVHVWLAGFAVTGALLMQTTAPREPEQQPGDSGRIVGRGAQLALICTLLQIPSGLWIALQMPELSRQQLLGGDVWASALFLLSLCLVFWLLHLLAAVAFGQHERIPIQRSAVVVTAVVLCMVGVHQRLHHANRRHRLSSAAVDRANSDAAHNAAIAGGFSGPPAN